MIPGPDHVIECPNCKMPARVFTWITGNTVGAKIWTDGKMIAPNLPIPPAVTRCKGCDGYFWLSDAKVIGKIGPWDLKTSESPDEWKTAERVRELSEAEYLEAIQMGVARNKNQELHLRISAWWANNDPLRFSGQDPRKPPYTSPVRSTAATANLECLLEQLGTEDPNERLMKAEVARELARFDDAIRILEFNFSSKYTKIASLIRELAQEKDPIVKEIPM
jgi:hypothetical protein